MPHHGGFWRKLLAFTGPGYLVAVGYMDPGNWATDIAGGSKYNYTLLSVVALSSLIAVFLQFLALKIGIATGRDLAQACRDHYSPVVSFLLWIGQEIAIAACDLAEVIGSAIALNLLFGLPLVWGVCLTAGDVIMVLFLQSRGFRLIEALVITLIAVISASFAVQMFLSKPAFGALALGLIPSGQLLHNQEMLYIAISILGATVMPHNLFLHSSIAQTRHYDLTPEGKREAIRFDGIDSTVALCFAFFINAAILIVAAATFYKSGHHDVAEIQDAYKLLDPLLGVGGASLIFAVALLASGQNSTLTGTLAGQIVMEGFLHLRLPPGRAPVDHPVAGHHPGRDRDRAHGRARHGQAVDPQPGDLEHGAFLCGGAAGDVHQRSAEDGRVRQRALDPADGLGDGRPDRRRQRLAALANVVRQRQLSNAQDGGLRRDRCRWRVADGGLSVTGSRPGPTRQNLHVAGEGGSRH